MIVWGIWCHKNFFIFSFFVFYKRNERCKDKENLIRLQEIWIKYLKKSQGVYLFDSHPGALSYIFKCYNKDKW